MGVSSQCVRLTTYFHLVLMLRIRGSTPPFLPCFHGAHRDSFTFTFMCLQSLYYGSSDSLIVIVIKLGLYDAGFDSQLEHDISPLPKTPSPPPGSTQLFIQRESGNRSLRSKQPMGKVNHLPLPNSVVKNEQSCTSSSPLCLHSMDSGNLPFLLY